MRPERLSLADAESEAAQTISRDLSDFLGVANDVFNTVAASLHAAQDTDEPRELSQSVNMALLYRISNDLRSAILLAERGYPLQASSLGAGIVEFAEAVMVIGKDPRLAQEWLDHTKHDDSFPTHERWQALCKETGLRTKHHVALSKAGVRAQDVDSLAGDLGALYRQLCLAKHGNPMLQQVYAYEADGCGYHFTNGPSTTETAQQLTRHALLAAALAALYAASLFVRDHLPQEVARRLEPSFAALLMRLVQLAAQAHVPSAP